MVRFRERFLATVGRQRGGVLAETALVMPFLLLILFGMLWFGLFIYTHIVVQLAASQGARVAAAAMADPLGGGGPPPAEKARGYVRAVIQSGLDLANLEGIAVGTEPVAGEDAVRVTVAYRYRIQVPFMERWISGGGAGGQRVLKSAVYRVETVGP